MASNDFLDENGVLYLWNKIKGLFNQGIKSLTISGTTITYTKGDGSTGTIEISQRAYDIFEGATASAAGSAGLVPAPSAGLPKVLLNNGAWEKLNIDIQDAANGKDKIISLSTASQQNYVQITLPCFSGSASGLVPKAGATDDTLFGDGTWGKAIEDVSGTVSADGFNIGMMINNGTEYKSVKIPLAASAHPGLLSTDMYEKLASLPEYVDLEVTYAKKTDITNVYKYKGSVASASTLPTTGQKKGDVYNIEAASQYGGAGMNVAWDGAKWDPLGEIFSITAITNAQLDAICV